jgi:hypothetical protein
MKSARFIFFSLFCATLLLANCSNPTSNTETDKPLPETVYTVTFNSNGGTSVSPITGIKYGEKITLPNKPSRNYYYFSGWFIDDGTYSNQFTEETIITKDISVFAKWDWNIIEMKVQSDGSLQGKICLNEVLNQELLNNVVYKIEVNGKYDNLPPDPQDMGIYLRDNNSQINTNGGVTNWNSGDWESTWNSNKTFHLKNKILTNKYYSYPFDDTIILGIWLAGDNQSSLNTVLLKLTDVTINMIKE